MPPEDYSPPTDCEACQQKIIFGPVLGGPIWSHLVDPPGDDNHVVQMRPEGYWDSFTGATVLGNPLRQRFGDDAVGVMDELARGLVPADDESMLA